MTELDPSLTVEDRLHAAEMHIAFLMKALDRMEEERDAAILRFDEAVAQLEDVMMKMVGGGS